MDLTLSQRIYFAVFVMADGVSNFVFPYFVMYIRKGALGNLDWSRHFEAPDIMGINLLLCAWVGGVTWFAWYRVLAILTQGFKALVPEEGNVRRMIEGILWTVNGLCIFVMSIYFVYTLFTLKSWFAEEFLATLLYSGLTMLFINSKYFTMTLSQFFQIAGLIICDVVLTILIPGFSTVLMRKYTGGSNFEDYSTMGFYNFMLVLCGTIGMFGAGLFLLKFVFDKIAPPGGNDRPNFKIIMWLLNEVMFFGPIVYDTCALQLFGPKKLNPNPKPVDLVVYAYVLFFMAFMSAKTLIYSN